MPKGSLDTVHNGRCYGWALDEGTTEPVEVQIFIDDKLAGRGLADHFRADLEQAGLRDGRLAFCVEVPDGMRDGCHHRVEVRSGAGEVIATRDSLQVVSRLTPTEFERGAPWIDADDDLFEKELAELKQQGRVDAQDEQHVHFFREHGYLILEQAVPHALIDKALADIEEAWCDPPPLFVVSRERREPTLMEDISQTPGYRNSSFRYLDFHNVSQACAGIMLLPAALDFVRLCFHANIAAMQTLMFENGSEQPCHQDFAFVHSLRPAALMGAWVALEDVRPDSGPLFYWDKSHQKVPKYTFNDGTVLAEGFGPHVRAYNAYLERTCHELALQRLEFTPRKGDMLIWHSALVHGGSPRTNPALTRKSMVSHYTTREAYPVDRRCPDKSPVVCDKNNCVYYGLQYPRHIEGRYPFDTRENLSG